MYLAGILYREILPWSTALCRPIRPTTPKIRLTGITNPSQKGRSANPGRHWFSRFLTIHDVTKPWGLDARAKLAHGRVDPPDPCLSPSIV